MLPMMVDSSTRADSVRALPHATFQYNYTIVNKTSKDINIPIFIKRSDSLWFTK